MHQMVQAYIKQSPEEQQEHLLELRQMIVDTLPDLQESIGSGFPVYLLDGRWIAGFASRKSGPKFYLMMHDIVQQYKPQLGKKITGKSCCLDYKASRKFSPPELKVIIQHMLDDTRRFLFIEAHMKKIEQH